MKTLRPPHRGAARPLSSMPIPGMNGSPVPFLRCTGKWRRCFMGGPEWTLVVILGPVVLGLALVYAILRNRKRTPADAAGTDRATHELSEEDERQEGIGRAWGRER